jgi:tetratricopeptide (TPR) repeat protein
VERRALDAHLGVCDLCRAAAALGALTDEIPDPPFADDDAVVARLAGRVAARAGSRAGRGRPLAIAAGVALVAVAGAAAAWVAVRRAPAPPAMSALGRVDPVAVAPRPRAPEIAPLAPVTEAVASARPASEGRRHHAAALERAAADTPEAESPDALFAAANAARGAGELRAAAARYEQLERRYPESPEATVSLVSAGDLLARLGEPAGALERFDRYLARNARGSLAPEALFGRARCLRALGRPHEEADAWRGLLARFPGSLYDRSARRRLDEMRADGPAP